MSRQWLIPVVCCILACGDGNGPGHSDPELTPRNGVVMAYDEARHQTVLFGGMTSQGLSPETWTWNGSNWSRAATSGPSGRVDAGMVYDAARQKIVLFGGRTSGNQNATVFTDSWEWNGSGWTQVAIGAANPGARTHFALGYDRQRQITALFGGVNSSGNDLPDVWEWNGQQWTHKTPPPPASNFVPLFAYDETAARLVLLTVRSSDLQFFADEWDGTAFTARTGTGPKLIPGGFVSLGASGGVAAHGGFNGTSFVSQTWSLNGTTWTQLAGATPTPRAGFGMSFDRDRNVTVLFGGETATATKLGDTWERSGAAWSLK